MSYIEQSTDLKKSIDFEELDRIAQKYIGYSITTFANGREMTLGTMRWCSKYNRHFQLAFASYQNRHGNFTYCLLDKNLHIVPVQAQYDQRFNIDNLLEFDLCLDDVEGKMQFYDENPNIDRVARKEMGGYLRQPSDDWIATAINPLTITSPDGRHKGYFFVIQGLDGVIKQVSYANHRQFFEASARAATGQAAEKSYGPPKNQSSRPY